MLRSMLHLASRSPRRSELLARLGSTSACSTSTCPNTAQPGEPAEDYVRRVAREKAGAGLCRWWRCPDAVVLGADTEVVLDDESSASRAMPPMPRRCCAACPGARTR